MDLKTHKLGRAHARRDGRGGDADEGRPMSTPKELAEATASAALESLQAALKTEVATHEKLRVLRRRGPGWATVIGDTQTELREATQRSDAAFTAWRKAQEAVPHTETGGA